MSNNTGSSSSTSAAGYAGYVGMLAGGWTEYRSLNKEDQEVFSNAIKGLLGVSYTPVAVATQVVNGINYSFFCNAKVVVPNAPNEAAMIRIHQDTDGAVKLQGITPVGR